MRSVLIVSLLGGCFSPSYKNGSWSCGPNNDCPSGMTCGSDGLCHTANLADASTGEPPDAPIGATDARSADASPPDAPNFPDAPPGSEILETHFAGDDGSNAQIQVNDTTAGQSYTCTMSACAFIIPTGDLVTVSTIPTTGIVQFEGWSGDCSGNNCGLTMDKPHSVTANFLTVAAKVTIETVSADGLGSGSVNSNPSPSSTCGSNCDIFPFNQTVVFDAKPAQGSQLVKSSTGDCLSYPCTLVVNGAKTVTATFTGGGLLGSTSFGGSSKQRAEGIALDGSKDVWIVGDWSTQISPPDGNVYNSAGGTDGFLLQWDPTLTTVKKVVVLSTGGTDNIADIAWNPSTSTMDVLMSVGQSTTFQGAGLTPGCSVAMFLPSGAFGGVQSVMSGTGTCSATSLAVDPASGTIYVAGSYTGAETVAGLATPLPTSGGAEGFVVALKTNGSTAWSLGIASGGTDVVERALFTSAGLFIGGEVGGTEPALNATTKGGTDAFVALLDPTTGTGSSLVFGGGKDDRLTGIAVPDPTSNVVYLLGSSDGSFSWGSSAFNSAGATNEAYVAELGLWSSEKWIDDLGPAPLGTARAMPSADSNLLVTGDLGGLGLVKLLPSDGSILWTLGSGTGLDLLGITPGTTGGDAWVAGAASQTVTVQGTKFSVTSGGQDVVVLDVGK